MSWTWKYSSSYNFGGYKEYRAFLGYDQTNYSTYSRCWWSIGVEMKYASQYGVQATASGAASGSCEGYLSSSPGGTWTTVCRKDSYFDVTRGTSAVSKTIKSTAKGKTVNGYGSAGGSGVSVSYTYSVPALASYTVSYHANGGSGAPSAQTKYYGKTLTLSSTKPTKSGYTFMGWGTSSATTSVSYAAGGSYTANASTTLYAIWRKTITLSYDANNGTGAPSAQSATVYNSTTSYTFTIPSTTPNRDGYNFKGWSASSTATTASYQPGSTLSLSSNSILYAVWEIAYIPPTIGEITCYRVDENGDASDFGEYAHIEFDWSIFEGAVDEISINAKPQSETTWIGLYSAAPTGTSGRVSVNLDYSSTHFDTGTTYELQVIVSDGVTTTTEESFISSSFQTMEIYKNGKGITFGASAEGEGFYCGMDIYFKNKTGTKEAVYINGSLTDYIVNLAIDSSVQALFDNENEG